MQGEYFNRGTAWTLYRTPPKIPLEHLKFSNIMQGEYFDRGTAWTLLLLLVFIWILVLLRGKWTVSNHGHPTGERMLCCGVFMQYLGEQ